MVAGLIEFLEPIGIDTLSFDYIILWIVNQHSSLLQQGKAISFLVLSEPQALPSGL